MKTLLFYLTFVLMLGLQGCASLVTDLVTESIHSADSFDYRTIATEKEIAALGFKKARYCSSKIGTCVSYLSAKPIDSRHLKYETELTSGRSSTTVQLDLARESVPNNLQGTIVLFHGFRASKEFMLNTALYFRFLGLNVVVPDLLGHGDSEGEKGYGVNDRYIMDELISSQIAPEENLFLLGNSMGALTAVYLSTMRSDIRGVILQAPMGIFNDAVLRYTRANHPVLIHLFSDGAIVNGALRALSDANLENVDTDIRNIVSLSSTPILLLASSADPVAPYTQFEPLNRGEITVIDLPGRSHPSMGVVGDESSKVIIDWLKDLPYDSD